MTMTMMEKKALYAFGCPNREVTVQRLILMAELTPEPTVKKVFVALADKLDRNDVDKWYRCFFYNMKLEMEAYFHHKAVLERIRNGCMEVDDDEVDED